MWQTLKICVRNTKTTVMAFLVAASALLQAVIAQIDNDPTTFADWNRTIELLLIAIGLLFARDGNKSSEDVGVK